MSRVKFELTSRLEVVLSQCLKEEFKCERMKAKAELAIKGRAICSLFVTNEVYNDTLEKLVPYSLLKDILLNKVINGSSSSLESYLIGSRITFKSPGSSGGENSVVLAARISNEQREYDRMLNRQPGVRAELEGWDEFKRTLSTVTNVILSIGGAGGAIFILSRRTIGWSLESVHNE